ncbi:hypothetical protein K490DRAFT_19076, partial [Saccharata proteae CBS 121410]
GMSMGSAGGPSLSYLQQMYWAVVGAFVGAATLVNFANYCLYRQRQVLSAAKRGDPQPAKPKSPWLLLNATVTALVREVSNAAIPPLHFRRRTLRLPSLGKTSIVAANIVVLLVLCFYNFDLNDRWSFENIGYRTGCISVAQFPLIFLLAGKKNIIGWLTGTSYERLNWLHRWAARCLLLTVTIHMGYWFADWAPYDYIGQQIRTNDITRHGLISWCLLLWIVISSATPIRGWSYEVFVLQHLVSMAVFTGFVYLHISSWPMYIRVFIWIPVGLFFFDRVVRGLSMLFTNLAIFHPKQRKQGQMSGLWACKAKFTPLPHETTRITIDNPPITWTPGQHVFLSCHSVVPLQSHPFTIASIPEDNKMEFLVKSENGGTKRFLKHAEKARLLPTAARLTPSPTTVAIEGPYGRIRPLRQFDSVVFFAGSSGATFTVPLLRDIVSQWTSPKKRHGFFGAAEGAVTRHVRFVWVVKSRDQLTWFSEQLSNVMSDAKSLRIDNHDVDVEMSLYVTCDSSFTDEQKTLLAEEKPAGACGINSTCCCTGTVENEDDAISPAVCTCNCGSSTLTASVYDLNPKPAPDSTHSPSSAPVTPATAVSTLSPAISVFSGRPQPKNIVRKVLEQALGESAVVVCGPAGLVDDVRNTVVQLSDERAIHKGTGAQGVYLHTEAFGY